MIDITQEMQDGFQDVLNPSHEFVLMVNTLADIFAYKNKMYGNFYANADEDDTVAIFEQYMMIKRKFSRLANYAKRRITGEKLPLEQVLDTMIDLSIYSIMGMMLVLNRMEKANAKPE
jgi:hypothetical protein